jgi:hypothetical protein
MSVEMLRCAQHDRAVTHTDAWINLLHCIIVPIANLSALISINLRKAHQLL